MSTKTSARFFTKSKPESVSFSEPPEKHSQENQRTQFSQRYKLHVVNYNPKFFLILLSLLFVGVSGAAVYTYHLYQKSEEQVKKLQNTKDTAKLEVQKTIDAVGKHIVLPKDETPTIATVTDSNKLKNQQFFAKASNGDKILIYTKAKKAILFNPTQNKVVEVAPVNLGKNNAEVAGAKAPTPTHPPAGGPTPTIVVQVQPIATTVPLQPTTAPVQ